MPRGCAYTEIAVLERRRGRRRGEGEGEGEGEREGGGRRRQNLCAIEFVFVL